MKTFKKILFVGAATLILSVILAACCMPALNKCSSYSSSVAHQAKMRGLALMEDSGAITQGQFVPTSEELWVIVKPEGEAKKNDSTPGCGAMMAKLTKEEKEVPLPLKHTDVKGSVAGYIATVEVTQQFHNPYSEKIEASYIFPLPENAAVNEFVMTVGERKIRGIIREREEAEKIYNEARQQGYVASLLTQERPNIFTQKVANIEPGKQIDVI
jgi:Ca-activated chloride channel homolog